MSIRKPTVEQLKAYRDTHQCGVAEAKAALMKQWRCEMLELVGVQLAIGATSGALQSILEYLQEVEASK